MESWPDQNETNSRRLELLASLCVCLHLPVSALVYRCVCVSLCLWPLGFVGVGLWACRLVGLWDVVSVGLRVCASVPLRACGLV